MAEQASEVAFASGPVAQQPGYQQQDTKGQQQTQYGTNGKTEPPLPPGFQPQQVEVQTVPGCPPGLEYLTQLDQVLMRQHLEVVELFTGCEMNNKYAINNTMGQQIFCVKEDTDCIERQCCGPNRGFTMNVTDIMGREVMRIGRDFKCFAGPSCSCCKCCDCCLFDMEVEAPPGEVIGYVKQGQYFLAPIFTVMDAEKRPVFMMKGPTCPMQTVCCTEDVNFHLTTSDGNQEIGVLRKQWAGLVNETISDADKFGVSFPVDLDVKLKATLIGLMFMIDFCFFARKQKYY
ncbi:phospholipid scramblase 1-like [Lineus longissimus]|uniref:phospholipid scramblase 1-like n=1 Tax=Lineus longissimus TaxID=88925 RepID=UPI002B4E0DD8